MKKADKSSSAGTEADSSITAQNQHVSQPNANTNVVGSREIKFRAWDYFNDVMVYDSDDETDFKFYNGKPLVKYVTEQHTVENGIDIDRPIWNQVDGPVMQYTGLKDKNGKKIYEGDIVRCNKPYRTTQTHEGDNIPNGSYTEPMEPGIKTIDYEVIFKDGTFYLDSEDDVDYDMPTPISWYNIHWDLEMIKDAISWTRQDAGWFDDPEEGDLQYLITECAKVENEEQLIKHLSGLEIIGNVFENPELL